MISEKAKPLKIVLSIRFWHAIIMERHANLRAAARG
jgi:hypothetical protein